MLRKLCHQGNLKEALHLVKLMIQQTAQPPVGSYIYLLKECGRRKALAEGRQVHDLIIQSKSDSNIFLTNHVIEMYCKCGSMLDAYKVFTGMPYHNVFSWTIIISGYADSGQCVEAISLLQQMQETGITPSKVTFVVALKACARIAALQLGKQLHALVRRRGFESDIIVQNVLVDMYARCGCLANAQILFNNMRERDVVSWNAMIQGYVHNGLGKEALALYEQMKQTAVQPNKVTFVVVLKACASMGDLEKGEQLHSLIIKRGLESDEIVQNTLVDMYARCGSLKDAKALFDKMSERDVVSWNAMMQAYVQNGLGKEALALYEQMVHDGVQPSKITLVVVLKVCASIEALEHGKQIHFLISSRGFDSDVIVQSALVDMYAKCGCLEVARDLFNNMSKRDVVCWSAIIQAYEESGLGKEALVMFEQMKQEDVQPNKVTFVIALKACASIAALEHGKQLHLEISKRGFASDVIVTSALVDMYAKCGCLDEACVVFNNMSERTVVSWNAMIQGCVQNGLGKESLALYERMKQEGAHPDKVTIISVISACSHSGLIDEARHIFRSMCEIHCITPTVEHYACAVDLLGRAGNLAMADNLIVKMSVQPG